MSESSSYEEFIGRNEVAKITGFSIGKIEIWVKKGSFPKPFRSIHHDFLGWTMPQLVQWQSDLMKVKTLI